MRTNSGLRRFNDEVHKILGDLDDMYLDFDTPIEERDLMKKPRILIDFY